MNARVLMDFEAKVVKVSPVHSHFSTRFGSRILELSLFSSSLLHFAVNITN